MVHSMHAAPRYDPRILELARLLDDDSKPIAETCRRVAAGAERLGCPRPSYVHLRRFVRAERDRREAERARRRELLAIVGDVAFDLHRGKLVDAYEVADRVRAATREHTPAK